MFWFSLLGFVRLYRFCSPSTLFTMKVLRDSTFFLVLFSPFFDAFSQVDPYDSDADGLIEIDSVEALNAIRCDLNGDGVVDDGTVPSAGHSSNRADAYVRAFGQTTLPSGTYMGYELTADLNFAGSRWAENASGLTAVARGWYPIGDRDTPFSTIFDGNSYTISNLYINDERTYGAGGSGLFGQTGPAATICFVGVAGRQFVCS